MLPTPPRHQTPWLPPAVLGLLLSVGLARAVPAQDPTWQPAPAPLMTRWGREVTPDNAWREHPDPQMRRPVWSSLNGLWDYAIRPRDEPAPTRWDGDILVPFCVESALSGVGRRVSPEEVLWYRRTFRVPATSSERLLLHFEASDWRTTVWLNGHELGTHEGGYDPFTFDLTDHLTDGEQELLVRVWDPTDAGTQPRGKQVQEPGGIWYTPVTGLWQSVWLEPVPEDHIRRLHLTPDLPASSLHVQADTTAPGLLEVEVRAEGVLVASGQGASDRVISVTLPDARPWSPDDPYLYDLKVRYTCFGDSDPHDLVPASVDEVFSYAGLRSIEVKPDQDGVPRLFLNGEVLFQYGLLDQGWWPDGLYTAPSDAALRYDLEVTKRLGFNMARKHVKVEPRRWYWWADKLGVLVWQDMPSGDRYIGGRDPDITRTPESARAFEQELKAMIDTRGNHPSVVMWVPYNEGWGQWDTGRIADLVKRWDPTRPVNPSSGWADRGVGDVQDVHRYPGPGMAPVEERRVGVLGEFGGLGLPLKGHTLLEEGNWGYRSFEDRESLNRAYLGLLDRLHLLVGRGLAAAVYTQTTDVEIEVNGVMTYDREIIKLDEGRALDAGRRLLLPPPRLETVMGAAPEGAFEWRYTETAPAEGWERPDFDDQDWSVGPGGFGTAGTPGARVGTEWSSEDLWVRRTFTLDAIPDDLRLWLHHDEDAEVYLNGVLAAEPRGYVTDYGLVLIRPEARSALGVGENVIAIHCHQTGGGQYLDAGLVDVIPSECGTLDEAGAAPPPASPPELPGNFAVRAVPFQQVQVDGPFWGPRMATNRDVTVWYDLKKCEETGRIANFARAGGLEEGPFQGTPFDDSDVYKVLEGASRILAQGPDPELDRAVDVVIAKIAAALEEDGYLYTARTLGVNDGFTGPGRWTNLRVSHELYNVGHLYEAAAAHHQATGKRTLLDVALKSADLVCRVFGPRPDQRFDVPGHQEIELGLVRLAEVVGDERTLQYLLQAHFFLDARGRTERRDVYGAYCQDHVPLSEQFEAVGHAVRAGYVYAAMAAVGGRVGDQDLVEAAERIWTDIVQRKMHVTGGIGASRSGEAFGEAYDLPNGSAYLETCAAIAHALFQQRMFEITGEARFVDVMERTIYNGFLAGVSLSGDRFFYPNPLACDGRVAFNQGTLGRAPWFGCSCCPVNVVRFLPALAGMVYGTEGDDAVRVNLYVGGSAELSLGGRALTLQQETRYPWDGEVRVTVQTAAPAEFTLALRIPGWAQGRPVPGDLYTYLDPTPTAWHVAVNGERRKFELVGGYVRIHRTWSAGDVVDLHLPMPVRRVLAHEKVEADRGRVALERGPLVFCLEGMDHEGGLPHLTLPDQAPLTARFVPDLLGGTVVLEGETLYHQRVSEDLLEARPVHLRAVPYHLWAHRTVGEMAVWLPRDPSALPPMKVPTLASKSTPSASHCYGGDTVWALNDQVEPARSGDHDLPRHTWWNHQGGTEWVQYDLDGPQTVQEVQVYWFDDTGVGGCRIPARWRVLRADGDTWVPVPVTGGNQDPAGHGWLSATADAWNTATFAPVTTTALRLEVVLQVGMSGGVLEWKLQ